MADILRPDMGVLWAEQGDRTQPDITKAQQGWEVEIPPRQLENWIQYRQDLAIAYFLQKGIPEWDISEEYYPNKSFVQYNGVLYKSKTLNTQRQPDTNPNDWDEVVKIEDATEEIRGIIRIASPSIVATGQDHERAVTPFTLKQETDKKANVVHTHVWADITNPPATYPPSPHTHPWGEVTGKPDTAMRWPQMNEVAGSLPWGRVSGIPATASRWPSTSEVTGSWPWNRISGIPVQAARWPTFNEVSDKPTTATRWPTFNEVTGKPATATRWPSWGEVTGKPFNNISITSGTIRHGGTIPLPAGYSRQQCTYMISVKDMNVDRMAWDLRESGSHVHMYSEYSVNQATGVVTCHTNILGVGGGTNRGWVPGTANWVCIAVR